MAPSRTFPKRAVDPVVSLSHQSPDRALNRLSRPLSLPDRKWFLENRGSKRPDLASRKKFPRTPVEVNHGTMIEFLVCPVEIIVREPLIPLEAGSQKTGPFQNCRNRV